MIERGDPLCRFFTQPRTCRHSRILFFSFLQWDLLQLTVVCCNRRGVRKPTPHTSYFLTDSHAHARLKSCVCRARIMCHPHVFVLTLRLLHFLLSADHLLSYHPVLPPAHQLHLPGCGGQIPCAHSLMRTLAPLPSTTLSQRGKKGGQGGGSELWRGREGPHSDFWNRK